MAHGGRGVVDTIVFEVLLTPRFTSGWSDDRLILEALAIFSLCTCFNLAQVQGRSCSTAWADALERSCYHAVQNHGRSSSALSTCFLYVEGRSADTTGAREVRRGTRQRARSVPTNGPGFRSGGALVTGTNWRQG